VDWIQLDLVRKSPVTGFCKDCNETLGSVKGGQFIDELRNYQLLRRSFAVLNSANLSII
jgi:hypothetical protein